MPGRRSFDGARARVTGASSGLGRAVAEGVPAADLTVVAADLTVEADRRRLLEVVAETFDGRLDLAFNVAGVEAYGRFESHDESISRRVFEINVFSLMEMCRGELPMLRRGERPYLVNMGSIVARRRLPGRSEYSASKFAVAGFTDAIRAEWSRDGIGILLVTPASPRQPSRRTWSSTRPSTRSTTAGRCPPRGWPRRPCGPSLVARPRSC